MKNLLHILTKDWMQTRRADELYALRDKLADELDDVVGNIQPLADRRELSTDEQLHLEHLRASRTQLGQIVEDLESVLYEKEAGRRAA